MRRLLSGFALAGLLALVPFSAEARNDPLTVARNHLQRAKKYFGAGRYSQAAKEWEYAYRFKPAPELLLNMAQALRLSGSNSKAKRLYERYLRDVPDSPYRAEVEGFIHELDEKLAAKRAKRAQAKAD